MRKTEIKKSCKYAVIHKGKTTIVEVLGKLLGSDTWRCRNVDDGSKITIPINKFRCEAGPTWPHGQFFRGKPKTIKPKTIKPKKCTKFQVGDRISYTWRGVVYTATVTAADESGVELDNGSRRSWGALKEQKAVIEEDKHNEIAT